MSPFSIISTRTMITHYNVCPVWPTITETCYVSFNPHNASLTILLFLFSLYKMGDWILQTWNDMVSVPLLNDWIKSPTQAFCSHLNQCFMQVNLLCASFIQMTNSDLVHYSTEQIFCPETNHCLSKDRKKAFDLGPVDLQFSQNMIVFHLWVQSGIPKEL